MFKIYQTDSFEKDFNKLIPKDIQLKAKKKINKLIINPYVGKPLSFKFFREIKIKGFRIYYLIYDDELILLLVGVSNKKLQNNIINRIKANRFNLLRFVNKFLNK